MQNMNIFKMMEETPMDMQGTVKTESKKLS